MDLFRLLGGLFEQAQPQRKPAPSMRPSQRDFPGRTSYGVPEDNMIDTPNGYVTAEQYDQLQQPRQMPNWGAVQGSVNPIWQQQRGMTPFSPGEGPRTNFNRFR